MDRMSDTVVASASDLVAFVACPHVTTLDLMVSSGELEAPERTDPMMELLQGRGLEHEKAHLERYRSAGVSVADVAATTGRTPAGGATNREQLLADRAQATLDAMHRGNDVIFQATFFDRSGAIWWRGHADFLKKVPTNTVLGEWGYEPEDTKLSTHPSAWAALQLCFYADLLATSQGRDVEAIHIVLGSGETVSLRVDELSAYFRMVRHNFGRAIGHPSSTYPLPNDHCRVCRWAARCHKQWEDDDHLIRVANLTVEQAKKLQAAGVPTLTALADSPSTLTVRGIGDDTLFRLRRQAHLQRIAVPGEPPPWEFVEPFEAGMGLTALPAPDPGDVFYDIEGHPYAVPGGLEYLHGLEWIERGQPTFNGWWAFDESQERALFERLIDFIVDRRRRHPGMHVYHYAPYEVTALKRLMSKYGTREQEMDDLLRGEVFVDLYRVVRQGIRVGTRSYSIKRLEPLYMGPRDDGISDGGSSIVEFERWLQTGDRTILDEILAYNMDDVASNRLLRDWLEARRTEALPLGLPVERPEVRTEPATPMDPTLAALIGRLNENRHLGAER